MASSDEASEVAIPLPGSWSDTDDEAPPAKTDVHTGGYTGASNQAKAILATAPGHDHSQRQLADGSLSSSLAAFATLPPKPGTEVEVFDCTDASFSSQDFLQLCASGPGRPALVRGVPAQDAWPARSHWKDQATFLEKYGHLHVQVTEMAAFHGLGKPMRVELTLQEYAAYARENKVDWPFYVWERNFSGDREVLLQDFATPKMMGDDLYDLSPEVREFLPLSCHLFVLVGGARTGSNLHKDPKWSSAWNTLLCGKKRWVMFPRDVPAEAIGAMAGDAYKDGGPPAYWWVDHYPHLAAKNLGMVDIVQCPGDTIFVPSGWWHATLNLPTSEDVTIACTRNIFPAETLDFVFPEMTRSDPAFARAFLEILREKRPELLRLIPEEFTKEVPKPALVGEETSWQLHRRAFHTLSLAACRRDFIRPGRPLIIEGLGPHLVSKETCNLSRDFLSRHFGEKMVAVFRNFRAHRPHDAEDQVELMRLSEAIAELQRCNGADGLYLYDVSLPLKLPGLLEYVKLPRYFTHCYLQQTMRPHCFSKSWPTLFIGAKGSQARLHVDQWHSHFWMHLVSGRKRWSIWHPEDAHLLCPEVLPGKVFPRFPDLADLEAGKIGATTFPQARRIDVVLEEGETLFVPGGAPHLVVNLTDTVAFAGNFLDDSNFEAAMGDIRQMVVQEGKNGNGVMSGFQAALEEMVFDPNQSMHEELLSGPFLAVRFGDFCGGAAAGWGPIPPDEMT